VVDSITPWIEAKKNYDIKISAVSVPFLEYKELNQGEDGTSSILSGLHNQGKIESLFTNPRYVKENIARNLSLFNLLSYKPDVVMLVDSDEFYTQENIKSIFDYVESTPQYDCYEINLKNYIFDGKKWIDGFHPFRIFRNDRNGGINQFYWDNDLIFANGITHKESRHITIPKEVAHIKHLTWLNNEKSKLKVQYHLKHFGACSYKWNNEKNELEIDLGYYDKYGYERPVICED
jgi:hypothetical protein